VGGGEIWRGCAELACWPSRELLPDELNRQLSFPRSAVATATVAGPRNTQPPFRNPHFVAEWLTRTDGRSRKRWGRTPIQPWPAGQGSPLRPHPFSAAGWSAPLGAQVSGTGLPSFSRRALYRRVPLDRCKHQLFYHRMIPVTRANDPLLPASIRLPPSVPFRHLDA